MKMFSLSFLFFIALSAAAADPLVTLDVWPGKVPGETGQIGEEKWEKMKVTNVSKPTIAVYPADKEKNTGTAVLVAPGGGYKMLMMDYEGADVVKWLNPLGITVIVLKYRVPDRAGLPRHLPALQDAQRAMSLVRSKAKEWNINPARIGMMGFSAGAHLAAATSTNFDKRAYETIDDIEQVSCRPDFGIVVYPGGIIDKEKNDGTIHESIRVSDKTPVSFIVMSHDDRVNADNAVYYYLALKKAAVQAELHIYATGGHGWGMRAGDKPYNKWIDRCSEWLDLQGLLKPAQ